MAENTTKTSFNGLAVPDRPIILGSTPIYGLLYNIKEDDEITQMGQHNIVEYIDYLVAAEQFEKNGGVISEDNKTWYLPDGIHSLNCNGALERITTHMVKWMVSVQRYEFEDCIEAKDGELDDDEPRMVIKKDLVDRYVSGAHTK